MSLKDNNRINEVIETTLKNINALIDVNTVIGEPIKNQDGELIIPFSKVTIGVLVGGGEYGKVSIFKNNENLPYSAGNGAVISIKPSGFIMKENNEFKVFSVSDSALEKLVDKSSEIISKLQNN